MPAATPLTTPVTEPTVAVPGALLVHEPVPVASLNVVLRPTHTDAVPVIATGNALIVVCILKLETQPNELVTVSVGV